MGERIELFLAITGLNVTALLVVAGIVWKDGRWKGRIEATLELLVEKVDKLERALGLNPGDEY